VADAWEAADDDRRWYAFNDVHAAFAYVGAGRLAEGERLVERMAAYVAAGPDPVRSNVAMTAEIGLPVARAITAFGRGAWSEVVATLAPIRRRFAAFGGSHAQRDALQRTLLEAALRDGRMDLAAASSPSASRSAPPAPTPPASGSGWSRRPCRPASRSRP
jgi:hypothetical protein